MVTNGHSEELLAEIRQGKEYKDTVDQINKKLGALSPKEALAACKASGKQKKLTYTDTDLFRSRRDKWPLKIEVFF
jgi:hypothetical protein